ncbi:uncharacterized protein LOC113847348 isoform X4 [Abrus precatorius]|uniref:Uncharacterized protein LOC113847348 isoform X4 n=1 Tax=Abrus precatorius TaxID=3816 RepID=A0A8B8JLP9_ABRPR|nr:uncharacterized protein LOC113847348 isoform X4 [Abrus precatorius]
MATLSSTLNCWIPHTTYSSSFTTLPHRSRYSTCSFAKKTLNKSGRDEPEAFRDLSDDKFVQNDKLDTSLNPIAHNSNPIPSRSAVLRACTITSALIAAFGIVIRQVSHVASVEGLPILDCSTEVSFGFEMWHLELIAGLVILISPCRYLLLKTWTDFAESSEAANEQVLSSLQPLDYIVVAFLPGITFPRCYSSTFGNELEQCWGGCLDLWHFAPRQWSEVFLCHLILCVPGQPSLVLFMDMLQFYPLALWFPWLPMH